MNIKTYFENLWFNDKETEIFLALYRLGTKPASIIAKNLNMERTYVYKILIKLSQTGLISETMKWGIKHFFIPDINVIKNHIKKKIDNFNILEDNFEIIKTQLQKNDSNKQMYIPKISIFDGSDGLNNIYDDILANINQNGYIYIKFFASNTLESQWLINPEIKKKTDNFYDSLKKQKITVESYLGNGMAIMENIAKNYDIDSLIVN